MSTPGWYPDPASPSGVRYWDGSTWTTQTRSAVEAGPASSPGHRQGGGRPWLWVVLALAVVGAVVAVLVLRPQTPGSTSPGDQNSSRPSGSQWNELEPTESPTQPEKPNAGEIVDCPQNSDEQRYEVAGDGRLHGGGLSFDGVDGAEWQNGSVYIPWLYDHNSQTRTITFGWMSNVSVGYAKKSEGFTTPRQTAESMMACLASSDLYRGFSGREDLRNEAFSLDGRSGWRTTANVRVDDQGDIQGDVVDVVVLDLGRDDQLAVFVSCATIDNDQNLREVEQAFQSLRVD